MMEEILTTASGGTTVEPTTTPAPNMPPPSSPSQLFPAQTIMDEPVRFPMNVGSGKESSTDTLTGTEASLLTATFDRALRSTSRVLVLAACQVNNDAASAREITLRVRRSDSNDSTHVQELVVNLDAVGTEKRVVTFAVSDSPSTTVAATYSLRGFTDSGSPTATNKSLVVLEAPTIPKLP